MKADKRIILKLLPAMTTVLFGCIAQPGAPDDTSSSAEPLTTDQAQQAPEQRQEREVRDLRVQNNVNTTHVALPKELTTTAAGNPNGGGDPSQDDGDGKEPDPHPWEPHCSTSTLTAQQH